MVSQIRRLAGQREVNGKWNGTFTDAEALVRELHEGAEYSWTKGAGLLRQIAAIRADGAEIEERIAELDAVYDEHRWNRYFLVTNGNGHVHRGMSCRTCFATTQYAWLVELADCDESAMIEEFGEKACTVCFPDAPANPKFHGPGRRDREAQAARQADKDAREAVKAARNLTEDQRFRNHMGDLVTTVAACKQALRDEVELKYYYTNGPHPWHAESVEAAQKARKVLLERGAEVAQLDKIVASAEKKYSKYARDRRLSPIPSRYPP